MKTEKRILAPLKKEVKFLEAIDENVTVKTLRLFGIPLYMAIYKSPKNYGFISKA